jgi:uncharacterized cupredoxin-like copper-binding protein
MRGSRSAVVSVAVLVAVLAGGVVIRAQETSAPSPSLASGEVASPAPGGIASPAPDGIASPASSPAGTTVGVTLQEFSVAPDATTIPAGSVTFNVQNVSPSFNHEFNVVRTDLSGGDLPTLEDGSFDAAGEGVEVVGQVEELAPGTSASATFDLAPGRYVFLCNVVFSGLSHYAQGMWVDIEVADVADVASPAPSLGPGAPASPAIATTEPSAS